jgi:ribosome-associated protein
VAREVAIRDDVIRLGQLLKLAGMISSGSDAKALLASEPVLVNGEPEERRGRQLRPGDSVSVGGEELVVVRAPS